MSKIKKYSLSSFLELENEKLNMFSTANTRFKQINLTYKNGRFVGTGGYSALKNAVGAAITYPTNYSVLSACVFNYVNLLGAAQSVVIASTSLGLIRYDYGANGFTAIELAPIGKRRFLKYLTAAGESLLAYGGTGAYCFDGTQVECASSSVQIACACVYKGRTFVVKSTEPKTIYALDYDGASHATLFSYNVESLKPDDVRGKIVALAVYGDRLYVISEGGVICLYNGGTGDEFVKKDLFFVGGGVSADSVAVCSDGIRFLAKGGIYLINESGCVKQKFDFYDALLPYTEGDECAAYYDGAYYLAARCLTDGKATRCVLCIRADDMQVSLLTVPAETLFVGEGAFCGVYAVFGGVIYSLTDDDATPYGYAEKRLYSGEIRLDGGTLNRLRVEVSAMSELGVSAGGRRVRYRLSARDRRAPMPRLRGDWFSVEVTSNSPNCAFGALSFEIDGGGA